MTDQWNVATVFTELPALRRRKRKMKPAAALKVAAEAGNVVNVTIDGATFTIGEPGAARHSSWDDLETGTRQ
jgi:hypothetical protein